ncbi:YokU family protein [Pseudalkalibacillus caeni]|uniref:YokU family protein n=1 Tax=Exobacillus caeni TaxID=2574798 RepID=A0A5R9FAA2_9BACL|nr:YokU family protein [Pseudalkalibacillus caeni]TLS37494.1 YokU family protein [Pseudalkalibacillus caeni]
MICKWCEEEGAIEAPKTGYWELPDGNRAIEIKEIPSIECQNCGMEYQTDETVEDIEEQLLLIDTRKLDDSITYKQLMDQPRFLKKNYFNFDKYPL